VSEDDGRVLAFPAAPDAIELRHLRTFVADLVLSDAHLLAERARAHGVDARLELYPATTHDFHIFWSFLPEAADALHEAGAFIKQTRSAHRAAS